MGPTIKYKPAELDSIYNRNRRIQFLVRIEQSIILDPLELNVKQLKKGPI